MPTRRASLKGIAEAAGAGTATVDRVVNSRGNVRGTTIERVRRTAGQLGFPAGLHRDDYLYRVLRQDPDHLTTAASWVRPFDGNPQFAVGKDFGSRSNFRWKSKTVWSQKRINELAGDAGGIAGVFVQNTLTREAISRTIERGMPVVTLPGDLRHPLNAPCAGLDISAVGRTAGYVPGRFVEQPSGCVLVTSETTNYLGLEEREMGLRSVLADKLPHLETSSVIEKGPDRDAMVQRVAVQAKDPNIVGIDSVGGRNSAIVDTMKMAGRQPGETVYVGSEPTETTRRLMIGGWIDEVIGFPANRAGKAVIQAMTEASGRGYCPRPGSFQPLQIHFVENSVAGA